MWKVKKIAAGFDIFRIISNRGLFYFKNSIDLINNTILAFLTENQISAGYRVG
jgi:hypothetical protein